MKNRINYYHKNGKVVIEENGKKYDYFNPMNDIIFKSILKGDKNHIIVKNIAKELLGLEMKEVLEKDNGFLAKGKDKKGEVCDYKVEIDGKTISIECNKKKSKELIKTSKSHLRRMIIDDGFGPVQVNIDGYDIEGKNKLYYEYQLKGEDDEEFYKDLIKIIHINIFKIKDKVYNESKLKLNKLEKICAIFFVREREVLEKLLKGDEEFMELKEVQEQIANDEEIYDEYSKSELYAMAEREEGKEEGREEGREKEKLEIAENLLKRNVDIDIIVESTGLSKEEVENLKKDK